ncbi:hypothetical protein [uncultured Bartonella sp.]|uniref:hypothetical protein n=1 Tax=uncultured Bartonella sp. TaxID=104108 RepID=UPI0025CBA5B0|nr:hypothetical protein [uncultured Bartonella sp.]
MFIRKFFWPSLTVIVFIIVMGLWFGIGGQERHLSNELKELGAETNWFSFDVDGFNVTVHGYAPDKAARDNMVAKVKALKHVQNVESDIVILSEQKNDYLMFIVDEDGITVRGTIPVGLARFKLTNLISAQRPGMMVYDEMDTGAVMPEKFQRAFTFFLKVLPIMNTGVIAVKGDKLTVDRVTLYKLKNAQDKDKSLQLPENYQIDEACIWDKTNGGYWENSCAEAN